MESVTLGPLETNCYLLGDRETREAVVIDPGAPEPALGRLVRDWVVRGIVLTHAHWDHFGGAGFLVEKTDAPLLLGVDDLDLYRDPSANLAALLGPDVELPEPNRLLKAGSTLECGNLQLQVASAPGHSPGGIILKGEGFAFTGDTIFANAVGRTDLPGGDETALFSTIEKEILTLPDETVLYPGHGPKTTVGQERISNPFLLH
ncbi:MAG: MBL fold metallo-hydrolase [Bacillota bacterium]